MPASSILSRWFGPSGPAQGSLLQKRIPTVLGLGILVLGIVAGLTLVSSDTATQFLPRASEDAVPRQVRITNITDTSFTVSFLTDQSVPGYVKYGAEQNRMNIQVRDDRDKLANTVANFPSHHVTIQGLQPSTQYYFLIGTGDRSEFDNNGAPFAVRTARQQSASGETKTAYGNIRNEVGNPADGAIVYLSIQGGSPLSALVKPNGSWAVQLTSLRTQDLSALYTYNPSDAVRVQVQGTQRNETIDVNTTVNDISPLQDLAFGAENRISSTTGTSAQSASTNPTPTPTPDTSANQSSTGGFDNLFDSSQTAGTTTAPDIDIELQNNEQVATQRPQFLGTAPANSFVQIEVHSEQEYFAVAQTDTSGNWNWTPPGDLEPGDHTITVTYTDQSGQQQKITRNFIVLAEGQSSLPAFTSSPSGVLATPTPTPVATPLPTPTPTPIPVISTPATPSAQPVSGSSTMTFFLISIGLSFFGFGMFVTRRSMQER